MGIIIVLFIFFRVFLCVLNPIGVSVGQANFDFVQIDQTTYLSWIIHHSWYMIFGHGEIQLRLLGTLAYLLCSVAILLLFKGRGRYLSVIFFNPWLNILSLWFVPELFTLLFFCLAINLKCRSFFRLIFWLAMIFSSLPGLIAGGIVAFLVFYKNKVYTTLLMVVWIGICVFLRKDITTMYTHSFIGPLQRLDISRSLDDDMKFIYLGANRTLMPKIVRKLAYAPIVYDIRLFISKFVLLIDPTVWTAPTSAEAITGLSGYPTKGIYTLFYYWEMFLLFPGILLQIPGVFVLSILLLLIPAFFDLPQFLQYGFFILPLFLGAIGMIIKKFQRALPILGLVFQILYVISAIFWLKQIFFQRDTYQLPAEYAYRSLYDLYSHVAGQYSGSIYFSSTLHPAATLLTFYSNSSFNPHFVFINKTLDVTDGGIYIGYEKEFLDLPGGKVLNSKKLSGEVVSGLGDTLWAIKY